MFRHGGLSKKQLLALGFAHITKKRGQAPTCGNVLKVYNEHQNGNEPLKYNALRSTFLQLEYQHRVVEGQPVRSSFLPASGGLPNGFYVTGKGMSILKSYINKGK